MRKFLLMLPWFLFASHLMAQLPATILTHDGFVSGAVSNNPAVMVFKGLPYAAPPVGANRWREPQPVAAWSGVRDATKFAPRCVQRGFAPGAEQELSSEDCLYLNIWTPAQAQTALLPVIVWIHGGGFFGGAGSLASTDSSNLASKGAVVIGINYRLGSFGFLAHPQLTAESPNHSSGNYAMLDMVQVLTWVYDNIAVFGGDPGNVTIMGESAGAQAVGVLLASPLSAGLFHHAIMQSSSWLGLSISKQATLAEREKAGMEQVTKFGAASITDLRQASAQQIFDNFNTGGSINVDGYFLKADATQIFSSNKQHPVDVLIGSNRDEANFFGPGLENVAALREYANNRFGALAEQFLTLYPASNDQAVNAAYKQAFNDETAWFMRRTALYQGERGLGSYVYFFTHVPPGQETRGATHVAELAYVFNQQQEKWTEVDRLLADQMSSYWINFATRSNPNAAGLPVWPAFRSNSVGSVLVLGDEVAAETAQVPSAKVLEFFDAAYEQHLESLPEL